MTDRLTNLPEDFVHCILSFLTFEDLARLGIVSKKCREFHLSTPSLNLDFDNQVDTSTCERRQWLLNSMNRYVLYRGTNKIRYFRVRWRSHSVGGNEELPCICDDEKIIQMIITWVQKALECKVEELVVKITSAKQLTLSMIFIFLSESLKSLVLRMSCTIHEAPPFCVSSNLRCLKLKHVGIDDEGFFDWMSSCCKFIEKLELFQVHGIKTITIKSSSLRIFEFYFPVDICNLNMSCEKLEDMRVDWRFDEPSNISVNVFAPNLRKLTWYGNLMNQQSFGKLEHLEEAFVSLEPEEDYKNVFELLCSLRWVRVLFVDKFVIKDLFCDGCKPVQLYNITYLCMDIGRLHDDLVPAVVSFFKGIRSLRTLSLQCAIYSSPLAGSLGSECETSGFNVEYWKKQNLAPFVHHLENVYIELADGSNGVELASYIIGHAKTLKRMTIVCSPKLWRVVRKLRTRKTVSNAVVVFKEAEVERNV